VTDENAFLQAVIADPDDDAPRLIYADWLDENGQSERAEFIRVQIALARMPSDDLRRQDLLTREVSLFQAFGMAWVADLPAMVREPRFNRGFVDTLICRAPAFLDHGGLLFQATPAQHLRLVDLQRIHISDLVRIPLLSRLSSLDLTWNSVGNVVTQAIARCPYLFGLSVLNLANNRIRRAGAYSLVKSPYLQSLEHLRLSNNPNLTEADQQLLRRHFGSRVQF